jgi:hypothetical protein
VTIVNETLARRFFGDLDPVGRTVVVFGSHAETVVGIVKDVKYAGLDAASEVTLYQPFAQNPFAYMSATSLQSQQERGLPCAGGAGDHYSRHAEVPSPVFATPYLVSAESSGPCHLIPACSI